MGTPAVPVPFPSPWGGINTREGLAALQPNEARYLENWLPSGNALKPRQGYMHASTGGAAASVKTLAAYDGPSTTALIGVNGGSIYDFSSSVAVLLSAAGYSDSRFQTECYNGYLFGVNGADTPWAYNGSAVVATGFNGSGLTITKLVNVKQVRNRLWFCEKDKADVWYGDIGAITGTLTKFQLSQIAASGYCVAIGAHSSIDSGSGPGDYTVFEMSTGEIIVYSGDPSTTFAIVGKYRAPPPIGRQCLVKVGALLCIITQMGLIPITAAVAGTAFEPQALGNFGKNAPTLQSDAALYETLDGWSGLFWNGYVIINVPTLDSAMSKQHVYNSLTGAWTVWTGFDAGCFAVLGKTLYWGAWSTGTVNSYGGANDNGTSITLKCRQAFIAPAGGKLAEATMIRFDMAVNGQVTGKLGVDVDYISRTITTPNVPLASSYVTTPWGSAWGSAWSTSNQYKGQWFSTYGLGRALGLALEATATSTDLQWFGSSVLIRPAGII